MDLTAAAIRNQLRTKVLGQSIEVFARTESTNDLAKQAAKLGVPHGHLIVADAQTAGRGAHGSSWSSPPGTDLYLSLVLNTVVAPSDLPPLTLAVGLGIVTCLEKLGIKHPQVKWPNDVLLGGKKAAGVLVESMTQGATVKSVVVGIGLNINRKHFDAVLPMATSLQNSCGKHFDRIEVLCCLLQNLEPLFEHFFRKGPSELIASLNECLAFVGTPVQVGSHRGVVSHVQADGALRLLCSEGEVSVLSGSLLPLAQTRIARC